MYSGTALRLMNPSVHKTRILRVSCMTILLLGSHHMLKDYGVCKIEDHKLRRFSSADYTSKV